MNIKTCDICQIELPHNQGFQSEITGKASLIAGSTCRDFSYAIKFGPMHFNCTNFDVCEKCLINAVQRAIASKTTFAEPTQKVEKEGV